MCSWTPSTSLAAPSGCTETLLPELLHANPMDELVMRFGKTGRPGQNWKALSLCSLRAKCAALIPPSGLCEACCLPLQATPKEIHGLMGLSSLTLDNIKSHLQKMRVGKLSRGLDGGSSSSDSRSAQVLKAVMSKIQVH